MLFYSLFLFCSVFLASDDIIQNNEINPWVKVSIAYLDDLRVERDVSDVLQQLKSADMRNLAESLDTKEEKLAFWINIYNAHVITLLREDPGYFENRDVFYKERDIVIGGLAMSLDEIEHGILRDSRIKWSLGYLQRWFEPDWIRMLRNEKIDGRIHFALNCGAIDCPPVVIYNNIDLDWQLNTMTRRYLTSKTTIDGDDVMTSPLFSWFRGDFGGKHGIKKFLVRFGVIEDTKVDLSFDDYDWTMQIGKIKRIERD